MIKDKYIIFLHDKFFIPTNCFSCIKYTFNIVQELENCGITVIKQNSRLLNQEYIDTVKTFMTRFNLNFQREPTLQEIIENLSESIKVHDIKKTYEQIKCIYTNITTFDGYHVPKLNVLYIKLIEGEYYSDDLYAKKNLEKERQMLFLLAGKLGVNTINYKTEIVETTISNKNAYMKYQKIKCNISYNKSTSNKQGIEGNEVYSNRGAPVYCLSKKIDQLEKTIEDKFKSLHSSNFSWEFYKNSPNLQAFVYKRCVLGYIYFFKIIFYFFYLSLHNFIEKKN